MNNEMTQIEYWQFQNRGLQAELEALIDVPNTAFIVVDKKGLVSRYNKTAEKIFGARQSEIIGRPFRPGLAESRLVQIAAGGEPGSWKGRVQGKVVLAYEAPILNDGQVDGAVGVYQDISEIEHYTRELAAAKRHQAELEAVFDSSYDGLWITNGEGKVLRINRAHERLVGLTADQVVGKNMEDLIKEGLVTRSVSLKVIAEKRRVTSLSTTRIGKKCLVTATPVFAEDGTVIRVITNTRDITELELLRTRLEKLAQKETPPGNEDGIFLRLPPEQVSRIVFHSQAMVDVVKTARKISSSNAPVLILGDSGTGKEVIARLIHDLSPRQEQPLQAVNCAAIPEALLESELFGYTKGAFSGANSAGKPGIIGLADKSTLLLDEIGEMPLRLQAKLLRVLEEGQLQRLGSAVPQEVDVRFIAVTNRDLKQMVEKKLFRSDLYFRLCVVPIRIPPLRERREDIPLFVYYFLEQFNIKYGKHKEIEPEVIRILRNYDWPGNVRELKNMMERLVLLTEEQMIRTGDLPVEVVSQGDKGDINVLEIMPLRSAVEQVEKQLLGKALAKYGSTYAAARALGISQSSVMRKAKKYFGGAGKE